MTGEEDEEEEETVGNYKGKVRIVKGDPSDEIGDFNNQLFQNQMHLYVF